VAVPDVGVFGREDGLNPWREGIEAIVLRTVNDQPTLWDSILPPELLVLPVELGRVDALLDDPVFFAPFTAYRCQAWPAVDSDGDLSAVDVSEVPLPAGL
jgi:IS5 family transposase